MKAKKYFLNGEEIILYSVAELSLRLKREQQTVRKWEKMGLLPPPKYKSQAGIRLYTEAQIQAIVKVVKSSGVKQGVAFPVGFKEAVFKAFNEASRR